MSRFKTRTSQFLIDISVLMLAFFLALTFFLPRESLKVALAVL